MIEVIIENLVNIFGAALIALIGIFGSFISAQLHERAHLNNINIAQRELIAMAQQTVGELQQTVVDGLKACRIDGKLTAEDIKSLGVELVKKTMEKMSEPAITLLNSAGVDITALIHGAAEEYIAEMKKPLPIVG